MQQKITNIQANILWTWHGIWAFLPSLENIYIDIYIHIHTYKHILQTDTYTWQENYADSNLVQIL